MRTLEITDIVLKFKTKYKVGFIQTETTELLKNFPSIDMKYFNEALNHITAICSKDDGIIIYKHDILKAVICGMESRELTDIEFD